ncbi:hypothetical protein CYMTET_4242 [Cymbomonas tetramitiformis]|uniref:NAD-dependent epimerase/dehydratase domain-containing protein n=1 Tax=Cymbomonas tetramitiformis TaxID=36881 RepID=A0AAE0H205_9CHLO|nr:hypothetical protein CYMTET_4242 [Cymbomonas tetramitiformis]
MAAIQEDEPVIERVLVIGGTGCLGAPTAKALKAAGYDVSVVSRGARAEGKPYGAGPGGAQNAYKLQQEEQLKGGAGPLPRLRSEARDCTYAFFFDMEVVCVQPGATSGGFCRCLR